MISYKPFFLTLLDQNISKTTIREKAKISSKTLAKISLNPDQCQPVSLAVIDRICQALGVPIENIVEIIAEKH